MKFFQKLTAFAVCSAFVFSLTACADFGVGEGADDFKKYFSGVYVLSKKSAQKYPIEEFNGDIGMEDTEIPVVVPYQEYSYVGFRVDKQYDLSISEFAFFAKTESGTGVLSLDFYVVDSMPTSIKGEDGDVEVPSLDDSEDGSDGSPDSSIGDSTDGSDDNGDDSTGSADDDSDSTVTEDEIFTPINKFHTSTFLIGEEWDSVLLQFDGSKSVNAGQYVVVRINNNCYFSDKAEEEDSSVSFTFNYLLFHFTDARKK
jgi:hypothetical protein